MKYNIIADSSCDLTPDYIQRENINFKIVPLTVRINDKEYIDDSELNVINMMNQLEMTTEQAHTSCPAPGIYMNAFDDADYSFCVTISSKLSGSYGSALIGAENADANAHIIDSKGVTGMMVLIIDKLVELIDQGLEYKEICQKIDSYRDEISLMFVLDSFDNLVKAGRMNKIASFFAKALKIKPICEASNGEIKMVEKPRTIRIALQRITSLLKERIDDICSKKLIISYCFNYETAQKLKEMLRETFGAIKVRLLPMRGLCSFYALKNGLIVSYEK